MRRRPKEYYQQKQELERIRRGEPASEKEQKYLAQIERARPVLPKPEAGRTGSQTADRLLPGQWLERGEKPIIEENKFIDP